MWAGNSGAWPQGQWPLQQSAYQNIPHEQVDWAALAQQWIQMKEAMNETCDAQPPVTQSHCPPSRPPPQPPPHVNRPLLPRPVGPGPIGEGSYGPPLIPERNLPPGPGHGIESTDRDTDNNGGSYDHSDNNWNSGGSGYWPSSSWNSGPPNWPPSHPPDNRDPPFEFGRNHGNQGYGVQTYNYNHGSDQFYFNQTGEQSSYNQYWTQSGSVNPPFVRGNLKERQTRGESPVVAEEETPAPFNLDAVKCKNLPAWIREGLEKMDRDKQKKLDRERMLQEREERLRRQQEEEEQVLREIQATKEKASMYQVRKSKFESDSEEDGDSPDVRTRSPSVRRSVSPFQRKTPSPIVTPKSEQEKLEEMMLKVRRMLTEILMEVTNEEISVIAKEIFNRERIKAPAQQLAKSSALASITDSLGLGDYGSDSETSGAEQEKGEDSDAELQGSIQRRKAEFAEREKQIAAAFKNDLSADDDETEDEGRKGAVRAPERSKQGEMAFIPSINSESGRERYHFEKKYAEIPGLGTQDDEFKRESTTSAAATTSKPGGTSGVEKVKSSSTESSRSTRSQSRSDSESSSDNSRKRKRRSSSKEKHGRSGSESSRSRSPPESSGRRNSRRESSDVDERASSGNRSGKNGREKDRRKRSVSRERRYRRPSDSRSSSRRSRSRSRERRRNSYNSGRRRSQRSRSRSRSYERSRYHRRDSRKRSRSRSSSSRSDRSRSRERRNSRRSHSRSPSKRERESIWAGKK